MQTTRTHALRCFIIGFSALLLLPDKVRAQPQLLMHLKLDEQPAQNGTGLIDSSGNGYHGTIINNNPGTDKSVPGINGRALRFDGTSDRVDAAAFDLEDTFTIAFWVNPATTADGQAFIGKHEAAGGNQIVVGFYSGYHFRIRGATFQAGTPQAGWQHIAVVAEATGTGSTVVTFYRNAIPLWTNTLAAVAGNTVGGLDWTLGQEWDSGPVASDYFTGALDDVAIWNGALTQTSIEHLVNGSAINVTTTADLIDTTDGLTSLREAVILANQLPGPNTINLPAGAYVLTEAGADEDASLTGDLDSTDTFGTLSIVGAARSNTIIDGNGTDRVLDLHVGTQTAIEGVNIRGGRLALSSRGGGVQHTGDQLTMRNSSLVDNEAFTGGGLINLDGAIELTDVTFEENYAVIGGGLHQYIGSATLLNVSFLGNASGQAGGMYLTGDGGSAHATLLNVVFSGNVANGRGGGLLCGDAAIATVINATFAGNASRNVGGSDNSTGGAIHLLDGGQVTVHNSILRGNTGFNGAPSQVGGGALRPASSNNLIEGESGAAGGLFVRTPDPGDGDWTTPGDNDYGDLHQFANSPSINAGSNGLLPVGLLTDFDGAPRIRQGKVDVGAYEHQAPGSFRVDQQASGVVADGRTWETAFSDLQAALAATHAGDEIWLKSGTYRPASPGSDPRLATSSFVLREDVDIYGGFAGTETLRDQRNPDPASNGTILSGDLNGNDDGLAASAYDNSQHVVRASDLSSATVLAGVTVSDGWARDLAHVTPGLPIRSPDCGAGLYSVGSSLRVEDVRFVGNHAGRGGGIYGEIGSALRLTRVVFLGNSAAGELTGVAVGGGMVSEGNPRMVDVVFRLNSATSLGGGLYLHGPSPEARLESVTFDENYAHSGGGFYNAGQPTLIDGLFTKNRCRNIGGGMLNVGNPVLEGVSFTLNNTQFSIQPGEGKGGGLASSSGVLVLHEVSFEGNTATTAGGALHLGGGNLVQQGGAYLNNRADGANDSSGGAIKTEAATDFLIRDVVFTGNSSSGFATLSKGGAIFQQGTGAIIGSQFYTDTNNRNGGAIFATNDLTIVNCLFEGNLAGLLGGALNYSPNGANADLLIANSVFSGNNARVYGGGAIFLGSGSATIRNVTLAGNLAFVDPQFLEGGAAILILEGALNLANSIIWQNWDHTGIGTPSAAIAYSDGATGSAVISSSIIQGSTGSGASWATALGADGGGNLDVDPLFITPVDPAVFPSPSWDLRLRIGSPAHNAGLNASLPADTADLDGDLDTAEPLPLDLAGAPRIFGAAVDVGAFEGGYTTFALTHPGLDPGLDANNNGLTNFDEYALGRDPGSLNVPTGPLEIWLEDGRPNIRLTTRGNGADASATLLTSIDLETWFPTLSDYPEFVGTTWPFGDLTRRQTTYRLPTYQSAFQFFKPESTP